MAHCIPALVHCLVVMYCCHVEIGSLQLLFLIAAWNNHISGALIVKYELQCTIVELQCPIVTMKRPKPGCNAPWQCCNDHFSPAPTPCHMQWSMAASNWGNVSLQRRKCSQTRSVAAKQRGRGILQHCGVDNSASWLYGDGLLSE
jgi:hypothetical protein